MFACHSPWLSWRFRCGATAFWCGSGVMHPLLSFPEVMTIVVLAKQGCQPLLPPRPWLELLCGDRVSIGL
jgi:hypothetical protein